MRDYGRPLRSFLLLVSIALLLRQCAGGDTMQIAFGSDNAAVSLSADVNLNKTSFGPDGPWNAVVVMMTETPSHTNFVGWSNVSIPVALWPTGHEITNIPTVDAGGTYRIPDNATITGNFLTSLDDFELQLPDGDANIVIDNLSLLGKFQTLDATINTSITAYHSYAIKLPNGKTMNETVGNLALGPRRPQDIGIGIEPTDDILEQLKSIGRIGSRSFSLTMGSAAFNQPGSLVLGGYEKNRFLGKPGIFKCSDLTLDPIVRLVDVALGVEVGASPFRGLGNKALPRSVYGGLGDNKHATVDSREGGGPLGSALVQTDPVLPYIHLPPGTCEEVASHIPVTLDSNLGLYLWDTDSVQYRQVVNSPAYLAFILSDQTATNVTIKVPFHLLNLTLTSPITDKPTQYFPCKSYDGREGTWPLGRAFLQAAFFAINYETNVSYLGQAPGPGMAQSVVLPIQGTGALESNSEDEFAKSWAAYWETLEGDTGASLSGGAIAGIAVGGVALVVILVAVPVFWRRRKRRRTTDNEKVDSNTAAESEGRDLNGDKYATVQELETPITAVEAQGEELAHEMPENRVPVELPVENK